MVFYKVVLCNTVNKNEKVKSIIIDKVVFFEKNQKNHFFSKKNKKFFPGESRFRIFAKCVKVI